MDDVDTYLSLRPRQKEWMPDIPGVHKLSKTDAQFDLDSILANLNTQTAQQQQQQHAISAVGGQTAVAASAVEDRTASRKAQRAAAAVAAGKPVKSDGKEVAVPAEVTNEATTPSRRARLQQKIVTERSAHLPNTNCQPLSHRLLCALIRCTELTPLLCLCSCASYRLSITPPYRSTLDSSHQTASELRVELDRLRSDVLAYEDAILTTKREIDNTKRERREIELNYDLIKEEFQLQLHKLMQARQDAQECETELRNRLSKSDSQNLELSERLNQLRQLEDEFNKKEQRIEFQNIKIREMEMKMMLYDKLRSKTNKVTTATSTTPASLSASSSSAATAANSTAAGSAAGTGSGSGTPAAGTPPGAAAAAQPIVLPTSWHLVNVLHDPLDKPLQPNDPLIPPDVFDAVKVFCQQYADSERRNKLLIDETVEQKIRLAEHVRSIQSLIMQLDRSTAVHAELNHAMKSIEAQYLDEQVKVEHSLKTIHLLQKQKADQHQLLVGYEERMKHFQQLLTAADVRADSANTFLSELLRGWSVLKYGNKQMGEAVKAMRAEYRKMRKERNEAYEQLHDKYSARRSSMSSSSAAPISPGSAADEDAWWDDKKRRVQQTFSECMADNARLQAEVDVKAEEVEKMRAASSGMMSSKEHEEQLTALHIELDEMKRFVAAWEGRKKEWEEDTRQEKERRELLEKELQRMQLEREKVKEEHSKDKDVSMAAPTAAGSATPVVGGDSKGAESASPAEEKKAEEVVVKKEMVDEAAEGDDEERTSKKRKLDTSGEEQAEEKQPYAEYDVAMRESEGEKAEGDEVKKTEPAAPLATTS